MKAYITLDELKKWGACPRAMRKGRRLFEWDKDADIVVVPLLLIYDEFGPNYCGWAVDNLEIHGKLQADLVNKFFYMDWGSGKERDVIKSMTRPWPPERSVR